MEDRGDLARIEEVGLAGLAQADHVDVGAGRVAALPDGLVAGDARVAAGVRIEGQARELAEALGEVADRRAGRARDEARDEADHVDEAIHQGLVGGVEATDEGLAAREVLLPRHLREAAAQGAEAEGEGEELDELFADVLVGRDGADVGVEALGRDGDEVGVARVGHTEQVREIGLEGAQEHLRHGRRERGALGPQVRHVSRHRDVPLAARTRRAKHRKASAFAGREKRALGA